MALNPGDASRFLCREALAPGSLADPRRIEARIEAGSFAPEGQSLGSAIHMVAWNLERGMHLDRQRDLLRTDPDLRRADVILLSEADRGCCRTGGRNVTRDLAEALEMHFAFAVQYVELPRPPSRTPTNDAPTTCEHGNAILSRVPLLDPTQLRHARTVDWFRHPREPRLGGAVSLRAGVQWGEDVLQLYSVHFDSGLRNDGLRASQARELVADASAHTGPVVFGGDMNAFPYAVDVRLGTQLDPTTRALRRAGYRDAHAALPARRRGTTDRKFGVRGVIDLLWTRGLRSEAAGVVGPRRAGGLSDHFPVWARLTRSLPY